MNRFISPHDDSVEVRIERIRSCQRGIDEFRRRHPLLADELREAQRVIGDVFTWLHSAIRPQPGQTSHCQTFEVRSVRIFSRLSSLVRPLI